MFDSFIFTCESSCEISLIFIMVKKNPDLLLFYEALYTIDVTDSQICDDSGMLLFSTMLNW